jgi:hypothetical protein
MDSEGTQAIAETVAQIGQFKNIFLAYPQTGLGPQGQGEHLHQGVDGEKQAKNKGLHGGGKGKQTARTVEKQQGQHRAEHGVGKHIVETKEKYAKEGFVMMSSHWVIDSQEKLL